MGASSAELTSGLNRHHMETQNTCAFLLPLPLLPHPLHFRQLWHSSVRLLLVGAVPAPGPLLLCPLCRADRGGISEKISENQVVIE